MLKWIITAILVSIFLSGYAQQENPLEQKLTTLWEEGDKYYQNGSYDSAFNRYSQVSGLAEQLDSANFLYIKFNIHMADLMYPLGLRKESIRKIEMALGLLSRYHPDKKFEKMLANGRLSGWYLDAQEFEKSIVHMNSNIKIAREIDSGAVASQYNNMGMIYAKLRQNKEALDWYYKAMSCGKKQHKYDDQLFYGIHDNIGEIYLNLGSYDSAFVNFKICEQISKRRTEDIRRQMQVHLQLGRVYTGKNQFDMASQELGLAENLLVRMDNARKPLFEVRIYDAWCDLYVHSGKYDNALMYLKKKIVSRESLYQQESAKRESIMGYLVNERLNQVNLKLRLEEEEIKRQQQELKASDQSRQFNRKIALIVGMFSLFLIMVGIMYIRSSQKRTKAEAEALRVKNLLNEGELKNTRTEKQHLENTLESKEKDISDLALYVSNLRNIHEIMKNNLENIKKMNVDEQANALKLLMTDIGNRLDISQKNSLIHENIEELNHEFYSRLQKKHPLLTKIDWDLCGLIRLDMNNKEIAALKNIEPESVKRSKNRLRKKLNLGPDDDLQTYLESV